MVTFCSEPGKKRELGLSAGTKTIGFIGRLVREKGIIDLIEALVAVRRAIPQVKLLVIGDNTANERDMETKNRVFELIDRYDMKENVVFTGYRSDVNELLAVSDIFVLPSYREGMPRSIIEAMASGKPVVATDIRGCREEVIDGQTGYIVPVGDSGKLAGAIIGILTDRDLAARMGEQGRKRADDCYDEDKVVALQIKLLREFMAER